MLFFKAKVRRVKFWWNLSFAYFSRYRFWLLASLLLFSSLIFTFYKLLPTIMRTNLITLGYVGIYTIETIPTEVLSLATQSFVSSGSDGKPIPSLASHWTVSDDGKTYVVFLKDNLKWHDESPVSAKDISIAITGVQITALNNKAIEFKLPNPIASFPLALDKPVFKAKSFYGTGQFRIVDIDQVEKTVKNISGAKLLENWPNLDVEKIVNQDQIITIFYNNEDPLLSSKDLRLALSYAINKSDFDGQLATSPISPTSWAYNNATKRYEYNTSKSKELLLKSGVQKPKIDLTYTQGLENLAERIQKDWQEIGIDVEVKSEKGIPKDFQALLTYDRLMPDPDQYSLWHSTQKSTNITRYKNVKIDKLLEDARTTQDEAKRKQLYSDFQRFLVEDAPVTFLYYPYEYRITYKNIKPLISKLPK